jgi:molybdopterin-containing oxidoreductase family iron-sulfur binding subunit
MSDTKLFKSYAELAQTEEYVRWRDDEFPDREGLLDIDRRDFVKLGAAGLALAGLAGCRPLQEKKAVPFVRGPEDRAAGRPYFYATALSRSGYGLGVLVEQHEGRPTKIEGNPNHPSSLGATDVWAQAEILNLYDPNRSQSVRERGETSSWDAFFDAFRSVLKASPDGDGVRILTESVTSPTLAAALTSFLEARPKAVWHQWSPLGRDSALAGTTTLFGKPLNAVYDLSNAQIVVSLDADFLLTLPGSVRYAREWADRRRVRVAKPESGQEISRLYAIESSYSITGASADHRLALKPTDVENVARALYAKLAGASGAPTLTDTATKFVDELAKDLAANNGAAVVIPGEEQSPAVHALAHAINVRLTATGRTVRYTEPVEARPESGVASLKALANAASAGQVKALLILGGNPVYDAPADLKLADLMVAAEGDTEKIPLRAHLSLYEDETSELCHWQLPASHDLESWGDVRGHDGTISVVQPLIEPLYDTRSALELVAHLADRPLPGQDLVRPVYGSLSADAWQQSLESGVVPGTVRDAVSPSVKGDVLSLLGPAPQAAPIEVNFRPDPTLWDGAYAGNAWLQELPRPITTIVWDNAAIISPKTASDIKLIPAYGEAGATDAVNIAQYSGRQKIKVTIGGQSVSVPAWILPGQPNGVVTLHLGGGRTRGGEIAEGVGFDVYPVRQSSGLGHAAATVEATGELWEVVYTQPHHLMRSEFAESANRDIVRSARIDDFRSKSGKIFKEVKHHDFTDAGEKGEARHEAEPAEEGEDVADWYRQDWKYEKANPSRKNDANKEGYSSLYPEFSRKGYNQWAMSIDLSVCTGCNACTIACQAENNIAVVGKDMVGRGREMHWIRLDHYFETPDFTDPDKVESHFLPIPCMQCEKAPCEPVCPVAATVHSHEGLNQMVYNRCIGTRYCSNNCPYKVRRFNFLKFTQADALGAKGLDFYREGTPLKMLANPDVSIRGRGVMEKCTYCVQRINEVRIDAKKEGREIQDGEIVTACQQVCPTQAIVFGDLNNPNSKVSVLKRELHDYGLLTDLNTRPRTTYLARIKNPNSALTPPPTMSATEDHH